MMQEEIKEIVEILKKGGIILYPTDTVWGIGCDATNAAAVEKIYKLKCRDDSKSMIILVDHVNMIYDYVKEMPDVALQLIEVNDKPMTLVYPQAERLAENVIASDKTVGIRICGDDFCKRIISALKKPIVSTSANISGEPAPSMFSEISETVKSGVDYVAMHRRNDKGKASPSSVIKVELNGEIKILRP